MSTEKLSVSESIAAAIRRDIQTGIIEDGEKLPSCREMALEKGVNPNTVQKAYSLLEREGWIEVLPQKGAYAKKSPLAESKDGILENAEKQLKIIKSSGVSRQQIKELVDKIYGESDDRN